MTSAAEILSKNLRALKDWHPSLTSQAKIGDKAKIDQRTVGRIINGEHEPTLAQVTKLAKAFELESWQLLVPDLEPNNPPMLAAQSDALKQLYKNLGRTAEAIQGFLEEGNTKPGEL